jgi:hypothetical protein
MLNNPDGRDFQISIVNKRLSKSSFQYLKSNRVIDSNRFWRIIKDIAIFIM